MKNQKDTRNNMDKNENKQQMPSRENPASKGGYSNNDTDSRKQFNDQNNRANQGSQGGTRNKE